MAILGMHWNSPSSGGIFPIIGSPELGITERIGDLAGYQKNAQGGSTLSQSIAGYTPTSTMASTPISSPSSYPSSTGQIKGINTTNTSSPSSSGNALRDAFNAYQASGGYAGWDPTAAWADFQTKNGNVGGGGGSSADDAVKQWEAKVRGDIESGYSQYEQGLRGLQASYGTSRDESLASAGKTYDQIFGGLSDQKAANLEKLQAGRQTVNARTASSIKDLQQNLANTLRGATMQFGAMGAGDTSATRTMLPYAYTKLAGAQEGSIRGQSNDQLFQIDQEERSTELEFSNMWRQTEVDKETNLQGIRDYYGEAIRNVQAEMARAPLAKQEALAQLNQSLFSEALANLRQLEAEDRQRKDQLRTWATSRMSELNNMKLSLANNAQFSPQDIVWQELQMQGVNPGGQAMSYPDYVTATRKKYLGEA